MIWVVPDARRRVHDFIKKHTDIPVAVSLQKGWQPRDGARIVVAYDGESSSSYAQSVQVVRVVVHAESLVRARSLMAQIDGLLLTPRSKLRLGLSISPGAGIFALPDSLVGGFTAYATYRIQMSRKKENHGSIA